MAHEIETMAFFQETPWHGLGTALDENDLYDWPKTCEKAGLAWDVELVPLVTADTQATGPPQGRPPHDRRPHLGRSRPPLIRPPEPGRLRLVPAVPRCQGSRPAHRWQPAATAAASGFSPS